MRKNYFNPTMKVVAIAQRASILSGSNGNSVTGVNSGGVGITLGGGSSNNTGNVVRGRDGMFDEDED